MSPKFDRAFFEDRDDVLLDCMTSILTLCPRGPGTEETDTFLFLHLPFLTCDKVSTKSVMDIYSQCMATVSPVAAAALVLFK